MADSKATAADVERFKELGFDVETIEDIQRLAENQAELVKDLEKLNPSEISEDVERLQREQSEIAEDINRNRKPL